MKRPISLFVAGLLLCTPAARSAEAVAVAPFLDEQAVVVVHADLAKISLASAVEYFQTRLNHPVDKTFLAAARQWDDALQASARAGGKDVYAVCSLADLNFPAEQLPLFVLVPLGPGSDEAALRKAWKTIAENRRCVVERLSNVLFVGPEPIRQRLQHVRPDARPELAAAFAATGDAAVQVVLTLPSYTRRVVEELMPAIPAPLGGGSSRVVLNGLQWAALGADLGAHPAARLTIQSADPAAAAALQAKCREWLPRIAELPDAQPSAAAVKELAELLVPQASGDRLQLELREGQPAWEKYVEIVRAASGKKP